jgi:[ribosomal protein S5]-alanine N-acetyltransferase
MMFQLKSPSRSAFDPVLVQDPIYMRRAEMGDFQAWASLRQESRRHLMAWEGDWAPEALQSVAFKRRLKLFAQERQRGRAISLLIFHRDSRVLIGGITLTNIRYGAARAATLGYWIGAPYVRQGFGAAAVMALVSHAVGAIGLNRIEAACQEENAASRALLLKCGFAQEGCARDYLRINDEWRDHDLFAITAKAFRNRERKPPSNLR